MTAGNPEDEDLAALVARLDVDDVAALLVQAALEHDTSPAPCGSAPQTTSTG